MQIICFIEWKVKGLLTERSGWEGILETQQKARVLPALLTHSAVCQVCDTRPAQAFPT